ncbi:hypothetical protein ABLE91_16890 [Aquabacter sp. CN5-332]|uniref:hypothetical protein n=1 Tax=Aquabacter sp. CN5-332 TaxID=3156608 RepID=UPI0032B358F0
MPNMVMINGAQVDADDPCALWQALYAFKLKVIAGDKVDEMEIRSPVTNRRTRWGAANIKDLDAELARLQSACDAKKGKRRRYAIRGVYRPY